MNRRLKFIAFILIVGLTFFGCNSNTDSPAGDTNTENTTAPENFKLIALGDSYTIGQSVCETCRFPAQLKDSLQTYFSVLDTFNLQIIARTGWTTSNLKSEIVAAVIAGITSTFVVAAYY